MSVKYDFFYFRILKKKKIITIIMYIIKFIILSIIIHQIGARYLQYLTESEVLPENVSSDYKSDLSSELMINRIDSNEIENNSEDSISKAKRSTVRNYLRSNLFLFFVFLYFKIFKNLESSEEKEDFLIGKTEEEELAALIDYMRSMDKEELKNFLQSI
jgi:hypothetical protein